ncbi:MAG: DUF4143 domain-containing protein [Lentimicrobiaceae bacterium]|nr:DUF4143 domain-containing protein [Lentimicrobiaceae bacterium]MDD4597718.1 DUF4143 domain-containing protein [Lentimicrobiaceae bacterium]
MDSGKLFESYVAAEMIKFTRTNRLNTDLTFYRTRSGMEIDFVIETCKGIIGMEVKNRDTTSKSDFINLKRMADAAGNECLGGIVLYRGNQIQKYGKGLWAIPSCRFFSAC